MKDLEDSLLKGQDLIVFGEDFGRHAHSLEHLLRPLFDENRFIWVETIGLRSPTFSIYDFKRAAEKLKKFFTLRPVSTNGPKNVPGNVFVVTPVMIPFNQFSVIRKFNEWSVLRAVKKVINEKEFKNTISVASVPNACDYVGKFNEILKVFVCVDEFSLWPGLNYNLVRKMENKLLSLIDTVFATSQALMETKSNGRTKTVLLTHGVDFQHFNIGEKKDLSSPLKICYFGLFDERNDQDIIAYVAQRSSNCEIHIFGKVVCNIRKLSSYKNIIFHGPVDYQTLPSKIMDMDVFILPYVQTELTRNINPLKLKEYLSTGRPVIATPLPEVKKLNEYLLTGSSGEEFVHLIKEVQKRNTLIESHATISFLQANETWLAKAKFFSSELKQALGKLTTSRP